MSPTDVAAWQRYSMLSQRLFLLVFVMVLASALAASDAIGRAASEGDWISLAKGLFFPMLFTSIFFGTLVSSSLVETRSLFLIQLGLNVAHLLPKRGFESAYAIDEFRRLLA